jgi:hypothetical protein
VRLEGRLARLEERLPSREDLDTARRREALKRMTGEELRAYAGAITRRRDGEPPAEGDEAIFARAWALYEEVGSVRGRSGF